MSPDTSLCGVSKTWSLSRKLLFEAISREGSRFLVFYPKIDYLLEEFFGELTHINLIPPGIKEADFDPEEEIRLIEELLYDNSSPRPPKESNSKISDATIDSFSPLDHPTQLTTSLLSHSSIMIQRIWLKPLVTTPIQGSKLERLNASQLKDKMKATRVLKVYKRKKD
ncbi:hypothetical protein Tco_0954163 [Tanacetum coccineum]|uniref:Uncharacterized protein n=1 Tax=Tanacetum coccineum TaxID=301880 RepID=A0ABQ5E3P9_9ASTR